MTTSRPPYAADVVIVGAGPTGLVAAAELARRGIGVRIIDKLAAPTTESRAIVIHARSLEMFDQMGLASEIINSGVKSLAMQMYDSGRRLARVDLHHIDSAYPFSVTTAQTETERILTQALHKLGVTVERGAELTGLIQDGDAVHLTVRRPDGAQERVDCRWVVGADGAHSTVRDLVGTRLEGSFQGERFMIGDVEAEHHLDLDSMYAYFAPDGPLLAFPMRGSRMRFVGQVRADSAAPSSASPTQEQLQQIVDERAGGIRITQSHWLANFEVHHAQAPAYRFGRVFLAGDAGHVHSPAGGQGMNTGMQDAFNLAWKLALTLQGRGGQRLLDSYQAERYPVAAKVIDLTTRLTHVITLRGRAAVTLRNEIMHAASGLAPIQHAIASQTEEVTLAYRHSPIVIHKYSHHSRVTAGDHAPHNPDAAITRQIGAAWAVDPTGHLALTIIPGGTVPDAPRTGSAVQVLVTTGAANVAGYDTVIADPQQVVAKRYGLREGGRVVIRPDGYIGLIAAPAEDPAGYFAQLADDS